MDNYKFNARNLDSLISATLARERNSDRERHESEYFYRREDFSELLRRTIAQVELCTSDDRDKKQINNNNNPSTNKERLELGHKIIETVRALELNLEEIDKGRQSLNKNNRSSGISLRSGASSATVKRRYNTTDGTITSVRVFNCENNIDEESIGSNDGGRPLIDNGDGDDDDYVGVVDPDKLLLGLAARDAIWRKQVVSVLNKAIDDVEENGDSGEGKSKDSVPLNNNNGGRGLDLTKQLGYFLFREDSPGSPKQGTKSPSFSFPPPEITRVIFDLTTYIAASAATGNDDFTAFGASLGSKQSSNASSFRSSGTTTTKTGAGMGRASLRTDILLATHFVLNEALPRWLKSFRPLKLRERAILWPSQSSNSNGTSFGNDPLLGTYTRSLDGDSSTALDSGDSRTPTGVAQTKIKEMREQAEYQVVDHKSRPEPETFFLATYYYTQKIIGSDLAHDEDLSTIMNQKSFVETYGAYLQIQTCLSAAASVKDEVAISAILKAATNDPCHRDAVREIYNSNSNGLLFYDSGKLSALLQCLTDVRSETKEERRTVLRDLCVSGYPDIQPWQVRDACLSSPQPNSNSNGTREQRSDTVMEALYYSYLSRLLNPVDGHEPARQDVDLVKEFCEWSVGTRHQPGKEKKATRSMENFVNVASRSSIHHESYRRDLVMLLDLSMTIENHDLALDLVDEIFGNEKLSSNKTALDRALCSLRNIGGIALVFCSDPSKETKGFETLRRIFGLFEKMATNRSSSVCRNSITIPDELFALFQQWKIQTGSNGDDPKMYLLIDFAIEVSSVPGDVVRALLLWSAASKNHHHHQFGGSLCSRLEDLLCRGIHFAALNGELSGTRLRLRYARTTFRELGSDSSTREGRGSGDNTKSQTAGIWETMATGNLPIEK
uniref:Uncharacterized protein n=1 Tax=Pseudo-nitzschia australis TaxID=44445 RepID=A0A7S4AQ97_9STRA